MKITYSDYLDSHIKCVKKISNTIWWFELCDARGFTRPGTKRMIAGTKHDYFKWKEIGTES